MPLPLRVDRVCNGVLSTLIRPRNPISFPIGTDSTAVINPNQFITFGLEKLLNFSEIRLSEQFVTSLSTENVKNWWNATRSLYGRLKTLEEDFAAFLQAYLHIMLATKLKNEDLTKAAIKYCELIKTICNKRISEKHILVELRGKEKIVDMYKMKKGRVRHNLISSSKQQLLYPAFVDMEVFDMNKGDPSHIFKKYDKNTKKSSKELAYIPLLIYDDLLECMLQNLKTLENFEGNILDPSFLIDNNVIVLKKNKEFNSDQLNEYSWLTQFDDIDLNSILEPITPTFLN